MQRVKELDAIRGLAALVIVLYHLFWFQFGLLGSAIDLFFVLSGYLITTIILSHPRSGRFLFAFYARRGLRIWPIYYLSLLFLVLVNPWRSNPGSLDGLPYNLTFTQFVPYYWSASAPAFIMAFRHTWSLAVEEQFYLIWPALLLLIGRKGLPWAATAVIITAVVMRVLGFNRWILGTNCDGLALGALLAGFLHGRNQAEAREVGAFWFKLLALGSAAFWIGSVSVERVVPPGWRDALTPSILSMRPLSLNLVFFALVGLTALYSGRARLGILRDRRLVYIGQISYGLYLYHHIVFILWDDYAAKHGLGSSIIYDLAKVGVSLAVAALSFRFVERPLLSLKDLFSYQSESTPAATIRREWIAVTGPEAG
jgi:peptidoglycan/LPS O-acetylase OafA/YrhL